MAGRKHRGCRFLLGILTVLLVSFPVLEEMTRPILLIAVVASVFVAGVIVVESGRFRVRNAVSLAVLQIVLTGLAVAQTVSSFSYLVTVAFALATTTLLIAYCIYCVGRYVLQASYITRDQIYAGMCAYLMLGFAFGCIYYLVEMLSPGCFSINASKLSSDSPDLMYFSFVTLATLGYGDITPVAKVSRALAEVEALAGMLYIAVFMAKLVSMAGSGPANIAVTSDLPSRSRQPEPSKSAEPGSTSQVGKPVG
jgi:hypothetical protein